MSGITLTLTAEQVDAIAGAVANRLEARTVERARKPLTVGEFADASGLAQSTVYRDVRAGRIRHVEGMAKVLIPASELERFK